MKEPIHTHDRGLVALLRRLVQIQSVNPPGEETSVAEFIADWANGRGIDASLDEVHPGRSNVYLRLRGSGKSPKLLFNSHLDVMPAGEGWKFKPFGGEISNGQLYGRGSADAKGSLAAMLTAAKSLVDSGVEFNGELLITGVIDEESTGTGTVRALERGITADYGVVGEPTELTIVTASKGDINFEVTTSGKAAHSSTPEQGVNAIHEMAEIITRIRRLNRKLRTRSHPLLGHPTISVDIVEGGASPWIIPEHCRIVANRRTLPGEKREAVIEELRLALQELKDRDANLIFQTGVRDYSEACEISPDEEIVRAARTATRHVLGRETSIAGLSGTTDARFLVNDAKIPTVILGPGSLTQAHRADEHIPLAEVKQAARIYRDIVYQILA